MKVWIVKSWSTFPVIQVDALGNFESYWVGKVAGVGG